MAGVTRPVQTKGRQKTEEEWKLAIYEACLAPLNEEDRTKFYDFLEEMAKGLKWLTPRRATFLGSVVHTSRCGRADGRDHARFLMALRAAPASLGLPKTLIHSASHPTRLRVRRASSSS
jgi:hypothetical protein